MSVGLQRLRDEPDVIRQGAVDKGEDESVIDAALDADKRRRDLLGQVERDRAQRNQWSQDVGRMIREGADPKSGAVEDLRRASRQAGERIEIAERELRDVEVKVEDLLLRIPNPADPDVPVGGEDANVTVRTWGTLLPAEQPIVGEVGADAQRAYLGRLGDAAAAGPDLASGEAWQDLIFSVAAADGLPNGRAFGALYAAFLGRTNGPRAGWLLASLDRAFVVDRLHAAAATSGVVA
jgi:hypothetical protein